MRRALACVLASALASAVWAAAAHADQRWIVVLRDQHPGVTGRARAARLHAEQAPIRAELSAAHAHRLLGYRLINAVRATMSKPEAARLAASRGVRAVVPDLPLRPPDGAPALAAPARDRGDGPAADAICPADPAVPLLEPEALQTMNVERQAGDHDPAAHDLVDGTGVKVAWIGTPVDVNHPDFRRAGHSIFFDYQDYTGRGLGAPTAELEGFGDAASIAAQGRQVYDLSQFAAPEHPLPPGCTIRIKGVAPGVDMAGFNIFDDSSGFLSDVLQAIDRAVTVDRVDVLNESIAVNAYPDSASFPLSLANTAATAAGVTVVAAAGDAGPGTIGSPADAPGVIGVGATTTMRLYRQATMAGAQLVPGGWLDDNLAAFSSSGFTQAGPRTVDLVAPGDSGWAVCTPDPALYIGCTDEVGNPASLFPFGGTSESAPLTAGVAALVIQAYAQTHRGRKPSPARVEQILVSSATDLGLAADEQGAGLVNALKAVDLAQSVPGDGFSARPAGSTLLVDRPALWATGPAGAGRAFTIHVTNTGEDASTVTPRQYRLDPVPLSDESGAVDSDPLHDPQFVDEIGAPRSYQERRFTVPAGAQHLSAVVTWNAALTGTTLERMTLFDPLGRIVAFTAPQGPSGFGQAVVHDPAPGTWTAVFWTLATTNGYQGPVHFRFTTQRFRPIGTVSPRSQRIPPGQTKAFTIHVRTRAGDLSSRLRLDTGHPDDGSIPITVRGLIPLASGGGSFHGTLTGGNGRGILGGPTLTYQFDVPPARPSLDVAVRLRDTGYDVTGLLVDPTGEPLDVQSTRAIDGGSEPGDAIQLTAAAPRPGRWTLLLVQNPPIDGEHLTEPLTGTIAFAAPAITVEDLPASAAVRLRAGRPYTAIVHVANTGIAPKQVYADPRLEQIGPLQLAGLTPTRIELPRGVFDRLPAFFVPTGSDRLTVTARSTVPLSMDVSAQYSSPDITSLPSGTQATAALSAPEVAPGLWFADPTETGPFGASPAPIVAADLTAAVSSHLFDPAVTSDTGDFQKTSVDPDTPFTPLVLAPRHSGSIRLTITPAAAEGTVVRGYVAIATVDPHTFSGDELIRLPYAYTVT